jgi:hypothetical protein
VDFHFLAGMAGALLPAFATTVSAQDTKINYQDRKALIVNNCPLIQLSGFSFGNSAPGSVLFFSERLSWQNAGSQPLVAFEIVILEYDAFDRRMIGSRWTVTGHNSGDWRPLAPAATASDYTSRRGFEEVFTAIAYVRAARLADGTVWNASDVELLTMLRAQVPGFKDFGDLKPDPKPRTGS